jgi:heme exporter protein C
MRNQAYKWAAALLVIYSIIAGFLLPVPKMAILHETIRNLYFHVPMWFGMIILLGVSTWYAIRNLQTQSMDFDRKSEAFARVGILFGVLGMITGMIWAFFTWGDWWSSDPKQNTSAISLLIYFAYLVLRGSFAEEQQRARISSVYNIFAFAALIPLLFILPRMKDSLHPGNGGNPGFGQYDLDNRMRMVFYPAVIGWTLIGVWVANLLVRVKRLNEEN